MEDSKSTQRPAWIEIDLRNLRHNAAQIRRQIGPRATFYAVVKGDAYGAGIPAIVNALKDSEVDAFAVGDFHEAMEVREHAPDATILLYGSYTPDQIHALSAFGIVLTLYSPECLSALKRVGRPLQAMVKVDCGFGRLGFRETEIGDVLRTLRDFPSVAVKGLYTHVGGGDDPAAVAVQGERFSSAQRTAESLGLVGLEYMIASSRILAGYPHLVSNAVNPGRFLYGLIEQAWRSHIDIRPVFTAVKSRLLQIKRLPNDRRYGYRPHIDRRPADLRVGIAAIGFTAGLPRRMDGVPVLVRGQRAAVVGLASMEHLLIDLTHVDEAAVGDEVALIGAQGNEAISGDAFSQALGMTELELVPRLGRGLRRHYLD